MMMTDAQVAGVCRAAVSQLLEGPAAWPPGRDQFWYEEAVARFRRGLRPEQVYEAWREEALEALWGRLDPGLEGVLPWTDADGRLRLAMSMMQMIVMILTVEPILS